MLIPLVSVSLIGVVVALRRHGRGVTPGPLVGAGLIGAWIGYVVGAMAGAVVGVLLPFGFWSFLVGHAAAVGIANRAVDNRTRLPARAGW